MPSLLRLAIGLLPLLIVVVPVFASAPKQPQPPGRYFPLQPSDHADAESFQTGQPIAGTTYFYWYDVYSGAHIYNTDGTDAMTTHPPRSAMADLSYKSPDWHESQLQDMASAGLDFFMPVFWGIPGQYDEWSFTGLPPLLAAHDRMLEAHTKDPNLASPPKIGLFYDTSTLQYNIRLDGRKNVRVDLTRHEGKEWFYTTIRDFFSMIPPEKWARIEGRPIVFLYAASFAAAVDERLFDDARRRFLSDFGIEFFLVRHADWPGQADAWYQWGGALGLTLGDIVAGLGPGYDHSAVPGRSPLVVNRENGAFYIFNLQQLLRMHPQRRPWIVHIETWNEWHEGTDIARSQDWGTRYIDLTKNFIDQFHSRVQLPKEGPFVNADRVRWAGQVTGGLTLRPSGGDGYWQWRQTSGRQAVVTVTGNSAPPVRYLYFNIDDSYMYDEMNASAELAVVFLDDGLCNSFSVQYDSGATNAEVRQAAFRSTRSFTVGKTGTWKSVRLQLPDVRFSNRANRADFRLAVQGGEMRLTVAEVILRKLPGIPQTAPSIQLKQEKNAP